MSVLDKPQKDGALLVEFDFGGQSLVPNVYPLTTPEMWNPADWTEVDAADHFTTVSVHHSLIITQLGRDVTSYRHRDFGAGFFAADGSYEWRCKWEQTAGVNESWLSIVMLANVTANDLTIETASGDFIELVYYAETSGHDLRVRECNGGVVTEAATGSFVSTTDYWIRFRIIQDGSGGGFGTVEVAFYSDPFETLVGSASLNLTQNIAFQYGMYGASRHGSGSSAFLTAKITEMSFGKKLAQSTISVAAVPERYTNWSFDLVHPEDLTDFLSVPHMSVLLPPYTGALDEKPLIIELPRDTASESFDFATRLSGGEPHALVTVKVWEYLQDLDETEGDLLFLYQGEIRRVTRNADGQSDKVRVEVVNIKAMLKIPMGIQTSHQCPSVFGVPPCLHPDQWHPDLPFLTEVGTITNLDGHSITITGLQSHSDFWWDRGYLEVDGLRLLIREWEDGTTFQMAKAPPTDWDGEDVAVTPGCDKTGVECGTKWGKQARFTGMGFALPTYNPMFESPS